MPLRPLLTLLILCVIAGSGRAAGTLHVIELHHRSARHIIPLLQPVLTPGEALTGTGYQLIVRATPAQLRDLETIVRRLDKARQRLLLTVRRATRAKMVALGLIASTTSHTGDVRTYSTDQAATTGVQIIHRGPRGTIKTRLFGTESRNTGNDEQQVQVLAGQPAFIRFGLEIPVPQQSTLSVNGQAVTQNSLTYKNLGSGFYALARIKGDTATVVIDPQRQMLATQGGGMIANQQVATTVSGKVNRWLDLGGSADDVPKQSAGTIYQTEPAARGHSRLWLKVTVLH